MSGEAPKVFEEIAKELRELERGYEESLSKRLEELRSKYKGLLGLS